ncbi:MAG: outer membrane beta-barrel protein [Polyangiaceae bacterium]|nr:outer membrane beta-barrel protein [Polyangiaceae bacterium]
MALTTTSAAAAADGGPAAAPRARRLGAVHVAIGPGAALCDRKKPVDECPVDGGIAVGLGGGYRLSPRWELGGEIAVWSLAVRESWKRKLDPPAEDTEFSTFYLAPHARYWFLAEGDFDPYVQLGFGLGAVSGRAENTSGGRFEVENTGFVYPVAAGLDWYASDDVRLGLQGLIYVHATQTHCERENDGAETCSRGTPEHHAVPWRVVLMGSWVFGER